MLEDIREVLRYLYHNTKSTDQCQAWLEVNKLKYLFRPSQPWTSEGANKFVLSAWNYAEFK